MLQLRDMVISARYLVVVNLLLLALAAYSASAIVGTALGERLRPPPEAELSPPPPPIPAEAKKPASHYALIHRRDIFNSAKPAPKPVAKPAPLTPLKLKLWGVALHDSSDSYCIIEDLKKRKQGLYRIGDKVPGDATVNVIEWDRVVLSRGGKDEILELATRKGGAAGKKKGRRGGRAKKEPPQPVRSASIEEVEENEFVIERAEVDKALENMSKLFTQIRAVPHFEAGKSTGFRLFAIRRGSLFDKIGLKNGDVIRSINGSPMTDPARAMTMLEDLREETDLTVELTRNRQPQTLTYQVR